MIKTVKRSKKSRKISASEIKKSKSKANTHEQTLKKNFEFGSECRYISSVLNVSAEGIT